MRTPLLLLFSSSLFLLLLSLPKLSLADPVSNTAPPLKIGIIAGLTGPFAEIGQGAVNAIQIGCDNWNARRKENFKHLPELQCFFEDDGFDTKKGISAYERLRSIHKIDALVNVNSTTIPAIAQKVRASGIPTVQVFLEGGTPAKDNIFQICPDMDAATEIFGKEIKKKFPEGVALLLSTNDVITRLADAFEKGYAGKTIRMDIPIEQADVRSIVLKTTQQNPQALYFITVPAQGVLIEKELRARGVKLPRIFDANFVSALSEYEKAFGKLDALADSPLLNLEMPKNTLREEFHANYKSRYKTDAPPWTEYSADAIEVLLAAYDKDSAQWKKNLQNTSYEGTSGKIEFSDIGATKPIFEIITVGELLKRRAVTP